jgi:uncharacterized coiled-coil protein SlyX
VNTQDTKIVLLMQQVAEQQVSLGELRQALSLMRDSVEKLEQQVASLVAAFESNVTMTIPPEWDK